MALLWLSWKMALNQPARPYYDTLLFLDINCYHAGFIYVFIGAVSFIVSGSFLMTSYKPSLETLLFQKRIRSKVGPVGLCTERGRLVRCSKVFCKVKQMIS